MRTNEYDIALVAVAVNLHDESKETVMLSLSLIACTHPQPEAYANIT